MRRGCSIAACLASLLLPLTLYSQTAAEKIPDLSGDWFHPVVLSISPSDREGYEARGTRATFPIDPSR
jgi:hypothetical protein